MKKFLSFIIILFFFFSGYTIVNAGVIESGTDAGSNISPIGSGQASKFIEKSGFVESITVSSIVGTVIQVFLSLLGIVFVVLLIYGGFLWMNARGNEEQVTKAKNTIQMAIIGLVIVTSAYAITYFVFNNLPSGSGVSGGGVQD